jgi:hypothetical protein
VGGPDRDVITEPNEPLQGPVLRPREFLGPTRIDQIGPRGRPDQQRSTGEHPDRPGPVEHQERQVLMGVPITDRPS